MTKIGFVSCSKLKLNHAAPAAALYSSPLFRKSLLAALDENDVVYILSALHGALPLDRIIPPYDVTLKTMDSASKKEWTNKVRGQLSGILNPADVVRFYAGNEYTRPLRPFVANLGCKIYEPLAGLSLGSRLNRLQTTNDESALENLTRTAGLLLRRLWRRQDGGRLLKDCKGQGPWPVRGLYIILESTENAQTMSRVVRIGTHAVSAGSKTTLWDRLITHRGTSDGRGSHRSSIFRLHVGRALTRGVPDVPLVSTWAEGQSASADVRHAEEPLERLVSEYLGNLRVLWLDVADAPGPASDRAYLERGLIGLYSRAMMLRPSRFSNWLGMNSPDWRIATSGLWNVNYVFQRPDDAFLDVFQVYLEATLGLCSAPAAPIAPLGWHSAVKRVSKNQLSLFASDREPNETY